MKGLELPRENANEVVEDRKNPYLDTFSSVLDFQEALKHKTGVVLNRSEVMGNKDKIEILVLLGSDNNFYILNQTPKGVIFVQTADTWEEAKLVARQLLGTSQIE